MKFVPKLGHGLEKQETNWLVECPVVLLSNDVLIGRES